MDQHSRETVLGMARHLREAAKSSGENGAALVYDATTGEVRLVVGDPFESAFEVYTEPVLKLNLSETGLIVEETG